jgi:general secretion pathway protein A
MNERCFEALRGLLNYETNDYKILQLILVAQEEIVPRLVSMKNFWDRVSLKHRLHALDFREMCDMVAFRLQCVGYRAPVQLFTEEALKAIHRVTGGFPRKVTQLCHDCLEILVMFNKAYVDQELVEDLVTRESRFYSDTRTVGIASHGQSIAAERTDAGRAAV